MEKTIFIAQDSKVGGIPGLTSTMPITSPGYVLAKRRTVKVPKECPTSTNGPSTLALSRSARSSSTICGLERGMGSNQAPRDHNCNLATAGCTNVQLSEEAGNPESITTAGVPSPM